MGYLDTEWIDGGGGGCVTGKSESCVRGPQVVYEFASWRTQLENRQARFAFNQKQVRNYIA